MNVRFKEGMRLHDADGSGYAARIGPGFDQLLTTTGRRAADLDARDGVAVRSRRHGRVLQLVLDMNDELTRTLVAEQRKDKT